MSEEVRVEYGSSFPIRVYEKRLLPDNCNVITISGENFDAEIVSYSVSEDSGLNIVLKAIPRKSEKNE